MRAVGVPIAVQRARRWADTAALVVLAAAVLFLAGLAALMVSGHRVLIVRSGSMAPAITTGDVVVTRMVDPTRVSVGDVVTFRDPSRSSDLVTHRVLRRRIDGVKISFLTKGDANTGTERWSVDTEGTIGKFAFRIPKVGYGLAWAGGPMARAGLVIGGALLLALAAIRRIWTG
jgi:signal peptidase I